MHINALYGRWWTVFGRKKPAFWPSKRGLAPVMVGISRSPVWHFVDENQRHDYRTDVRRFEVYASNLGNEEKKVELRLQMYVRLAGRNVLQTIGSYGHPSFHFHVLYGALPV